MEAENKPWYDNAFENNTWTCKKCGTVLPSGIVGISDHWTKCEGKIFHETLTHTLESGKLTPEKYKELYWKEEMRKCKESPVYFYNNYFKPKTHRDLTEKEWNDAIENLEIQKRMASIKFRRPHFHYQKIRRLLYPEPEEKLLNEVNYERKKEV